MSIQRYRTNHISGDYYPENGGELVLYADHVAAVKAEAESAHDLGVIYGINHERARIRAGVEALPAPWPTTAMGVLPSEWVLAVIDGEDTA